MTKDDRFICHPFLQPVVDQDVKFLIERDRTYGGSWKKGGGRSSYYMTVRKMDRLQEIMKKPPPPEGFNVNDTIMAVFNSSENKNKPIDKRYLCNVEHLADAYLSEDIFAKIQTEEARSGGVGADGSVLAEIRDLRRYLCLIEAECYARGYVNLHDPKDDESIHAVDDEA